MTESLRYPYAPLGGEDGIRLVRVEITETISLVPSVSCQIKHFNLSSAPPYRALSYTWADETTSKILLNAQVVEIRRNLWQAMRHFQYSGHTVRNDLDDDDYTNETTKWMWIDAVCIDQYNMEERNQQVRLMGRIYASASEVLVWLGCAKEFSNGPRIYSAVKGLDVISRQRDDFKAIVKIVKNTDQFQKGLWSLVHLPYWRRLWIAQEIGLAAKITILFDRVSTSWDCFHQLRGILGSSPTASKSYLRNSLFTEFYRESILASRAFELDLCRTQHRRYILEELIESCRDCLCSDPKDKIYGLLGLAEDCQNDQVVVDYSKSMFELYSDVIRFYHASRHPRARCQHIVRFSQLLQQTLGYRAVGGPYSRSDASFEELEALNVPFIHVLGLRSGTIETTGTPFGFNERDYSLGRLPKEFQGDIEATPHVLRDMDKLLPITRRFSFAIQATSATQALLYFNSSREILRAPNEPGWKDRSARFTMDNGQNGYGPANSQKGDVICQFLGCDVAVILRSRVGGYDLISRAFIEKSKEEAEGNTEPWAKKYEYAVPDSGSQFSWTAEQAMYLYMDIITLQQITEE